MTAVLSTIAAMRNEFFPPCRCFHFLRFYSCLKWCVPAVWMIAGMWSLLVVSGLPQTSVCLKKKQRRCRPCEGEISGVCKSHQSKAPLLWWTVEFNQNPPPKYLLLQRHDSDFPLLSVASLIYALQSSCLDAKIPPHESLHIYMHSSKCQDGYC